MDRIIAVLDEWRRLNGQAKTAEAELSQALQRELDGGSAVSEDLVRRVAHLRKTADERLSHALLLMSNADNLKPQSATLGGLKR